MKPILFSTPMVQAILEGRKTQTRRIIKNLHPVNGDGLPDKNGESFYCEAGYFDIRNDLYNHNKQPGNILWVRETWQNSECFDYQVKNQYVYKANRDDAEFAKEYSVKWRPSIFMPREACRLFLKVKNVRVERLQEISGQDVLAEGVDNGKSNPTMGVRWENMQRMAFRELWDGLNKQRGYGWDVNPWVWVIEFERVNKPV